MAFGDNLTVSGPVTCAAPTEQQLRNRYAHHAPKGDQAQRYEAIRSAVLACAVVIARHSPVSREQTRALNALDEAMMLANAAIARNE